MAAIPKIHMIKLTMNGRIFLVCSKDATQAGRATDDIEKVTCKICLMLVKKETK